MNTGKPLTLQKLIDELKVDKEIAHKRYKKLKNDKDMMYLFDLGYYQATSYILMELQILNEADSQERTPIHIDTSSSSTLNTGKKRLLFEKDARTETIFMKYKQSKNMLLKRRKAEKLKKQGKTIRDIMQILGYKSTSAVAHLLSKS